MRYRGKNWYFPRHSVSPCDVAVKNMGGNFAFQLKPKAPIRLEILIKIFLQSKGI